MGRWVTMTIELKNTLNQWHKVFDINLHRDFFIEEHIDNWIDVRKDFMRLTENSCHEAWVYEELLNIESFSTTIGLITKDEAAEKQFWKSDYASPVIQGVGAMLEKWIESGIDFRILVD